MLDFPTDVLLSILSVFPPADVVRLESINHRLNRLLRQYRDRLRKLSNFDFIIQRNGKFIMKLCSWGVGNTEYYEMGTTKCVNIQVGVSDVETYQVRRESPHLWVVYARSGDFCNTVASMLREILKRFVFQYILFRNIDGQQLVHYSRVLRKSIKEIFLKCWKREGSSHKLTEEQILESLTLTGANRIKFRTMNVMDNLSSKFFESEIIQGLERLHIVGNKTSAINDKLLTQLKDVKELKLDGGNITLEGCHWLLDEWKRQKRCYGSFSLAIKSNHEEGNFQDIIYSALHNCPEHSICCDGYYHFVHIEDTSFHLCVWMKREGDYYGIEFSDRHLDIRYV